MQRPMIQEINIWNKNKVVTINKCWPHRHLALLSFFYVASILYILIQSHLLDINHTLGTKLRPRKKVVAIRTLAVKIPSMMLIKAPGTSITLTTMSA